MKNMETEIYYFVNLLKEFLTEEQIVELYKIDNEKIDKIEFVY